MSFPTLEPIFFAIPPSIQRCTIQDTAYFAGKLFVALVIYSSTGAGKAVILSAENLDGPWQPHWQTDIYPAAATSVIEQGFRRFASDGVHLQISVINPPHSQKLQIAPTGEVTTFSNPPSELSQPLGLIQCVNHRWFATLVNPTTAETGSLLAMRDENDHWQPISNAVFDDSDNIAIHHLMCWNQKLVLAFGNRMNGFQIWTGQATATGDWEWQKRLDQGALRYTESPSVSAMAVLPEGNLLIGTGLAPFERGTDSVAGCELLCLDREDDEKWQLLMGTLRFSPLGLQKPLSGLSANFGSRNAHSTISALFADNRGVFAAVFQPRQPAKLWFSQEGLVWKPLNFTENQFTMRSIRTFLPTPWGILATGTWQGVAPERPIMGLIS